MEAVETCSYSYFQLVDKGKEYSERQLLAVAAAVVVDFVVLMEVVAVAAAAAVVVVVVAVAAAEPSIVQVCRSYPVAVAKFCPQQSHQVKKKVGQKLVSDLDSRPEELTLVVGSRQTTKVWL